MLSRMEIVNQAKREYLADFADRCLEIKAFVQ